MLLSLSAYPETALGKRTPGRAVQCRLGGEAPQSGLHPCSLVVKLQTS